MSDLISRETAIDALKKRYNDPSRMAKLEELVWAVEAVPSAEPERTAKVKDFDGRSETSISWEGICTKCGAYTMHEMNYCFHCGAKLEW